MLTQTRRKRRMRRAWQRKPRREVSKASKKKE